MSTFFSNTIIGMDSQGYGSLLGKVSFTCSRVSMRPSGHELILVNPRSRFMSFQLSAHWASMHKEDDTFVLIPFPFEKEEGSTVQKVEEERQKIQDGIIRRIDQR